MQESAVVLGEKGSLLLVARGLGKHAEGVDSLAVTRTLRILECGVMFSAWHSWSTAGMGIRLEPGRWVGRQVQKSRQKVISSSEAGEVWRRTSSLIRGWRGGNSRSKDASEVKA